MAGEIPPRIAIFGAGLIGIFLGAMLADDAQIILIGRPSMLDPLADGVRVTDVDGTDRLLPPGRLVISTDAAALSGAELVLVTVKCMATAEAAAAIAAHAPADAPIISFQNGVSNADMLHGLLPGRRVLAGMVPYNVAQRGPAHFHRGTGGGLVVAADSSLARFVPVFAAAGVPLLESPDIAGVQWGKLLINLNNAINALSGLPLMQQLMQRDYRRVWAASIAEGLKLVKAAGIAPVDLLPMPLYLMPQILRLPDPLYRFIVAGAGGGKARVDPHARSSMAEDLARGRPTEVDWLQGEIVRLADRLGRSAPINARVLELVHAAESGAPPLSGKAMLAALKGPNIATSP